MEVDISGGTGPGCRRFRPDLRFCGLYTSWHMGTSATRTGWHQAPPPTFRTYWNPDCWKIHRFWCNFFFKIFSRVILQNPSRRTCSHYVEQGHRFPIIGNGVPVPHYKEWGYRSLIMESGVPAPKRTYTVIAQTRNTFCGTRVFVPLLQCVA